MKKSELKVGGIYAYSTERPRDGRRRWISPTRVEVVEVDGSRDLKRRVSRYASPDTVILSSTKNGIVIRFLDEPSSTAGNRDLNGGIDVIETGRPLLATWERWLVEIEEEKRSAEILAARRKIEEETRERRAEIAESLGLPKWGGRVGSESAIRLFARIAAEPGGAERLAEVVEKLDALDEREEKLIAETSEEARGS